MVTEAVQFKSFIGVDLHKCTVTLRAVDREGKPLNGLTCSTKCLHKIHEWLLPLPRPSWMAIEACPFAEWFIDEYRGDVDRTDIADATELSRRRGKRRKNDPKDAGDIAVRLARGECPLGWIADEDTLRLRKLGRHWCQLSRLLAQAKTMMRFILLSRNVRGPQLDGASAQKWLLAHGHLLRDESHLAFANFVDFINVLERQREQLRRRIILANRSKRFAQLMAIVKSVPGIDEIWACIIVAEIGDFGRFPNGDTIEFWSGLTADNRLSAGKSRAGHITKAGSKTLRWALCCAARCLARHDRREKDIRLRILKNCGGKKAKAKANTAMGRRLLRILFAMVRDGTGYQNAEPTNHLANANRARRQKRQALVTATE